MSKGIVTVATLLLQGGHRIIIEPADAQRARVIIAGSTRQLEVATFDLSGGGEVTVRCDQIVAVEEA